MDQDPSAPAASAASVFGCDDLLHEILLRLGFPHFLVRAALVSKQWLLHVSDLAFLCCFRDRHPPHLLGFCAGHPFQTYEFVPLPQPPELAAYSRRASSCCNDAFAGPCKVEWIHNSRNGRLAVEFAHNGTSDYSLLSPLHAKGSELVLPADPPFARIFLCGDAGRDAVTLVRISNVGRKFCATICVLGSSGWGVPATAVREIEPMYPTPRFLKVLSPVHGNVFVVTAFGYMVGLDLTTPQFFILELPDGVERNFMLSCAPNSGLYLVSAEGFQISLWLHQMSDDNYGAGGWLLVDTFCVHEACARIAGDIRPPKVDVVAVDNNADFVFLDHPASGVVFYVHLRNKVVEKVYQGVPYRHVDPLPRQIFPIMTLVEKGPPVQVPEGL